MHILYNQIIYKSNFHVNQLNINRNDIQLLSFLCLQNKGRFTCALFHYIKYNL